MPDLEEKVYNLESLMTQTQLMIQSLSFEVSRTQIAVNNLSREMKDFKDHTQSTADNLSREMKQDIREMNKKWGELANKWGTIVEDLVAPNIESIGEKYFNLKDCDTFLSNVKKRKPREKEFDVIAVYENKVILVEVKSTPRTSYIEDFVEFIKNREFYSFFPEYQNKEIIPVFASLKLPDNTVIHLSRNNILAMAMSDDIMDILNPDVIKYLATDGLK